MSVWTPTVKRGGGPAYVQIVDAIRNDVRSGRLVAGTQLPTHRALARSTGLTVDTVTSAYREATRQHLVHARVGRGTFVLGAAIDASLFEGTLRATTATGAVNDSAATVIDLSSNTPAYRDSDMEMRDALQRVVRHNRCDDRYPTPRVLLRGQAMIADLLRVREVFVRDAEVVMAAGAQQALLAALSVVAGAGGKILVEELTFPGMKAIARHLNLQLIAVRIDRHGLVPADLDRVARSSGANVVVCVPCLHNPTSATMTRQRRDEIARVARKRDLTIIEDDVYGSLQDEPALASTLPSQTLVITGLSKSIAPGLRLGAIAGRHEAINDIRAEVSLTSWTIAPTMIEVASQWATDGTVARRIAWQRDEIKARNDLLRPPARPSLSPHCWMPVQTQPDRAAAIALDHGVLVVPSTVLAASAKAPKGIRISLTAPPDRSTLHDALQRLAAAPIRWK